MKANEFVKKVGWDAAKEHLEKMKAERWINSFFNDLNSLVKNHEMVESCGGLNGAKNTLSLFIESIDIGLHHGMDGVDANTAAPMLKQAIADVESCM